jgi:hypothetical protein
MYAQWPYAYMDGIDTNTCSMDENSHVPSLCIYIQARCARSCVGGIISDTESIHAL